jgi:SAM-dependent methyltransferase
VTAKDSQYARQAQDWTEHAYADVTAYLEHRAELIVELGEKLDPGDGVLDLACGDAGLGEALVRRGLRYRGVDSTLEMVDAARRRLGAQAEIDLGDLNDYVPPDPVAATTVFRAIYYARDRAAFFRHVSGFTEKKVVFDLNPRQYRVDDVLADLRAAGLSTVVHPFFVPQTVSLPGPILAAAKALERTGPLARLALRMRFTYLVAASRR